MKFKVLVFICAFGLSSAAFAALVEGVRALQAGEYAKALREIEPLAKQGDANAQFNFGLMFSKGWGVPRDYEKAAQWYRKAAEQGVPAAQRNLGGMYYSGQGVAQSDEEAVKWYRLAAEQGYAEAENNLGFMYANGFGVPRDYTESARWFRKAAEQGYPFAQNALGYRYEMGQGVLRDIVIAYVLYSMAAANGNDVGARNIARIAPFMTDDQLKESRKLISHWKIGMPLPGTSKSGAAAWKVPVPFSIEINR